MQSYKELKLARAALITYVKLPIKKATIKYYSSTNFSGNVLTETPLQYLNALLCFFVFFLTSPVASLTIGLGSFNAIYVLLPPDF